MNAPQGWYWFRMPPSPLLEPLLALLSFAVVVSGRILLGNDSSIVWTVEIAMCVVAALSAMAPVPSAFAQMVLMVIMIFWGNGFQALGFLTVNTNLFALTRLKVRYHTWITSTLLLTSIVIYVVIPHDIIIADRIATAIFMALMGLLGVGGGMVWRKITVAAEHDRELAERRMASLRVALARDLHDTVAQTLTHAAIRSYLAADDPRTPEDVRRELLALAADCNASASDLRQLLSALRESDEVRVDTLGIDETLEATLEHQQVRLLSIGLEPEIEVDIAHPSPAQATTLSKISVEAVANMIKHATPLSRCTIEIRSDADKLTARFTNPTSARRLPEPGMGLVGVRERAALLGGTSEFTLLNGIWTLSVELPLNYAGTPDDHSHATSDS